MSESADDEVRTTSRTRRTVIGAICGALVVVGCLTAVGTALVWNHLDSNIGHGGSVDKIPEDQRPDEVILPNVPHQPMNILVMGTDTRDCDGCAIDSEIGGNASDTTILLHLSANRDRVYGVSIPRDSMVDRPDCTTEDGTVIPGEDHQIWNEAFSLGGPLCTVQQVEATTGVRIHHYVVVNFASFKDMVDAVGGVEMCIPETIDDREFGIYLKAGTYKLDGDEALMYVRERHGIGDGSDIGRVKRQQAFVSSMVHQVLSSETLTDPTRILSFLNAVTASLYVDEDLAHLRRLAGLAWQFRSIDGDNVKFITVPWTADPDDPNRIVWDDSADEVWDALIHDEKLPDDLLTGQVDAGSGSGSKAGSGSGSGSGASPRSGDDSASDAELEAAGLCV